MSLQTAEAEKYSGGDDDLEKALEVHLQGESQKSAGNDPIMSTLKTKNPLLEAENKASGAALEESAVQEAR